MARNSIHIPQELVLEIFKRLPVKCLCRLMCLSQSYRSSIIEIVKDVEEHRPLTPFRWVIKEKEYLKMGLEADEITSVFLDSMEHTGVMTEIDRYELDKNDYVCYCNGLICALTEDHRICIFNLTTCEAIYLPSWCHDFEFCYDRRSRKYKVLGWRNNEFRVLTVERGCSWRRIGNNNERMEWTEQSFFFFLAGKRFLDLSSTAAIGKVFWAQQQPKRIISFDIAEERWFQLGLPDELNQLGQNEYEFVLFEMENYLGLVEQRVDEAPLFNMWVLKDCENENSWIKMRSNISLPFEDNYLEIIDKKCFVCECYSHFIYCNGEIVILVTDGDEELYAFMYNLATGNSKPIRVSGERYLSLKPDNYIENNISLHDLIE